MPTTSSVIKLSPGIYILRYPKGGTAPLSIGRAPGTAGDGQLNSLHTEATQGAILRDGSDCIVLQVSRAPVELLVTAFLAQAGDPVPALRLDQIALDATPTAPAAVARPPAPPIPAVASAAVPSPPIAIPAHGISLIGHVESAGDLVAPPGQSLGTPASGLRLEGFQVMWPDRPADVDLAYGVAIEGYGPIPVVKSGKFCGTRNEARRITEVTFALVGAGALQYQLDGVAHFSGGFQMPIQSGIPLSGPSGLEHLTAISLRAVAATVPQAAPNPWAASSRTKVFKADRPADSTPPPQATAASSPPKRKARTKKPA
ncbi:MAG: hypothetical protein ACEQSK_00480 [Sphingomonadaceae bacterium]